MKIRFQADNDLHEDILRSTKRLRPGLDFQRAPELGLHTGIGDPEVLRLCAEQNRMLVTHDRHTMPDHFIEFIQHHDSPGIFIVSRSFPLAKRLNGWRSTGRPAKPKSIITRSLIFLERSFLPDYCVLRNAISARLFSVDRFCLNTRPFS